MAELKLPSSTQVDNTNVELALVKAELQSIKNQLAALGVTVNNFPAVQDVQLTGSNMEHFGDTIADRPAANTVPRGAYFMIIGNADTIWQSNGTDWVVLQ